VSDSLEASMMKRIGELKAENARLKADVNELADGLKLASEVGIKVADEVTRLKAEVERLTKAGDAMKEEIEVFYREKFLYPSDSYSIKAWHEAKEVQS